MEFQRFTSEYDEIEDRLSLIGEDAQGAKVRIWITRRLFERLLPVLLRWLDNQTQDLPRGDLMQGFVQAAARAKLRPQPPVRAHAEAPSWLAAKVDVNTTPERLLLTLHPAGTGEAAPAAHLPLSATLLRQWLAILHGLSQRSGWSPELWPEWIAESNKAAPEARLRLH
ncbi:MAG: hypothetical protein JXM75_05890 [Chromatiaceae bacterium]|nr:hypothetical protein [Chromatiaceae bacterium]